MHTELRLSRQTQLHLSSLSRDGDQIVEVWFDRQLIGTVAALLYGPGVQIVTALPTWVGMNRDDPPSTPECLIAHATIGDAENGLRIVSVVITPA